MIQQSLNSQICLFIIFLFKMYIPTKKYLKKGLKIMHNGSNCDRKSQLSDILKHRKST